MRAHSYADSALGVAFAVGGALVFGQAMGIKSMPGLPVGPGLFPAITGAAMVAFGLVLAAQGWFAARVRDTPLLPKEQSAETAASHERRSYFGPFVVGILAAIAASTLLMPVLGFLITGALFVFAVVLLSGGRLISAFVFSPIASAAIYAMFAFGFRVPLPRGLLG